MKLIEAFEVTYNPYEFGKFYTGDYVPVENGKIVQVDRYGRILVC